MTTARSNKLPEDEAAARRLAAKKRYRDKNKKKIAEYREANKARIAESKRNWAVRNRDRLLARKRAWYHGSVSNRVSHGISNGLRKAIFTGKRGRKWESLVGYSLSDLMPHLERQFTKGMSWDNYGEWHIDHIVPQASFTISSLDDPELRRAWALSNLRPLWASENYGKKDRRTHLI